MDIAWSGELRNRESMLTNLRMNRKRMGESNFGDLTTQAYGTVGIVRGLNVITTKRFGTVRVRFTDVFLKRNGKWRAIDSQETLVN